MFLKSFKISKRTKLRLMNEKTRPCYEPMGSLLKSIATNGFDLFLINLWIAFHEKLIFTTELDFILFPCIFVCEWIVDLHFFGTLNIIKIDCVKIVVNLVQLIEACIEMASTRNVTRNDTGKKRRRRTRI